MMSSQDGSGLRRSIARLPRFSMVHYLVELAGTAKARPQPKSHKVGPRSTFQIPIVQLEGRVQR